MPCRVKVDGARERGWSQRKTLETDKGKGEEKKSDGQGAEGFVSV